MSIYLLLLSAFMATETRPSSETSPEVADRLKEITSVLQAQEVRRQPVLIRYRVKEYRSAQLDRAFHPKADPRSVGDRNLDRRYELALKGTRSYIKCDGPFNLSPAAAQNEQPSVWVFDGHGSYERYADRYAVSSQRQSKGPITPWDVTGEKRLLGGLRQWSERDIEKQGKKFKLTVQDDNAPNSEALVRYEVVLLDKSAPFPRNVYWLQPRLGYAVWKHEQYNANGSVKSRRDQCVYEVIGDKAYPKSAVWTDFEPGEDGQAMKVLWRKELQVESIETDPDRIPDSLFHLEIPKDEPVYDIDSKTMLHNPQVIQDHLDRLAAQLPERRSKRWWPAIVTLSVLAMVLIGLGAWVWRTRKRAGAPA